MFNHQPTPYFKFVSFCYNRRDESIIHRLRLGKCGLNFYLYKIGKHDNGVCEVCQEPEDISHYLLSCTEYILQRNILCDKIKVSIVHLSLHKILQCNLTHQHALLNYVKATDKYKII